MSCVSILRILCCTVVQVPYGMLSLMSDGVCNVYRYVQSLNNNIEFIY
jgi:hypothetical protein